MLYCDYYYVKAHFLSLNCYCIIITYYYKLSITYYYLLPYYKFINTYYYIIITLLFHHSRYYDIIIIFIRGNHVKMKHYYELCNEYASIITSLLHIITSLLHWGSLSQCVCVGEKCKNAGDNKYSHSFMSAFAFTHSNTLSSANLSYDFFFLPTPRNFLSFFRTYCPFWVQVAQMVVHFTHFQIQARKRGVLGCE